MKATNTNNLKTTAIGLGGLFQFGQKRLKLSILLFNFRREYLITVSAIKLD